MGVDFTLEVEGSVVSVPDPSGGECNAAGDFDALLPVSADLPMLHRVDVYGEVAFVQTDMAAIVEEAGELLTRAKEGPERRGVLRLRASHRTAASSEVQSFALAATDNAVGGKMRASQRDCLA
jgi:hypothetical protein